MTIFITDGSVNGFYCALFKCFSERLIPDEIVVGNVCQPRFGDYTVIIETDEKKAARVRSAIINYAGTSTVRSIKKIVEQADEKAQIIAFDYAFKILSLKKDISDEISDPVVNNFAFTEKNIQNGNKRNNLYK